MKAKIKKFKNWLWECLVFWLHLFLAILAWLLIPLAGLVTYIVLRFQGRARGFFLSSAGNLDRWAGREFRVLWNMWFILEDAYKFGHPQETMSGGGFGKNQRDERLSNTIRFTKSGRRMAKLLDRIEKKHCEISIDDNVGWGISVVYNNSDELTK